MLHNLNYDFESSLPLLKHAVELNPHNGRIVHALGATYYNLNKYDEAIDCFNRARKYEIDKYIFYLSGLCNFNKKIIKKQKKNLNILFTLSQSLWKVI